MLSNMCSSIFGGMPPRNTHIQLASEREEEEEKCKLKTCRGFQAQVRSRIREREREKGVQVVDGRTLYFCDHKKKFFLPTVFSSRGKDKATFAFTITRHTLTPPPDDNFSIFSPSYFASFSFFFRLHLLFSKFFFFLATESPI